MSSLFGIFRGGAAAVFVVVAASAAQASEPPIEPSAALVLGADVKGENWTVAPVVESDGYVRIFELQTPYGNFRAISQRRMDERLHELRALQILEKMSRTKAFGDALAKAGMAPIRFGGDLITDPVGTTGNVVTGIGNTFDSVVAGVSGNGSHRDSMFESAVGITKAERDLAATLDVDPYTDFTPLRDGLADVAHVMAAGDITVDGALSAIPGGAGIAVSATSTASDLDTSIDAKTSNEIMDAVTKKLVAAGVDPDTTAAFVANHFYSPEDQFAVAESLEKLGAANSAEFVSRAATADRPDVAKLWRYRAELLARESAHLGTLKSFEVVSGVLLNRDASGRLVGAFRFDDIAWTDKVAASMTQLNAGIDALGGEQPRVFATTGTLSPMAESELKNMGWTVVALGK